MQHTTLATATSFSLIIQEEEKGQRIDKFLSQKLPSYSRSFFQQLIDNQRVTLDGQIITKASMLLKQTGTVVVTLPQPAQKPILTPSQYAELGIEVIHTHPHFLILYKPAHVLVHPSESDTYSPTLVDWLTCHYEEIKEVGDVTRPGIVHRLDKDTSGLLVIPRTNHAHMVFGDMFKKRTIKKTYFAIVHGHPAQTGSIDLPIGRNPVHRKKMMAFPHPDAFFGATTKRVSRYSDRGGTIRPSLTNYQTQEYFSEHALVHVQPVTGRTHQIRVHFASAGHPLIGDQLYGKPSKLITRQALHAHSLDFEFAGEAFHFEKEPPADFQELVGLLRTL